MFTRSSVRLRREDRRGEQLVRVVVVQRAPHVGILVPEPPHDFVRARPRTTGSGHRPRVPSTDPCPLRSSRGDRRASSRASWTRARRSTRVVAADTGHAALGDAVWRDLARPEPDSLGLLRRRSRATCTSRAATTFSPRHWAIGLAVTPARATAATVARSCSTRPRHVAAHGGGQLVVLGVRRATRRTTSCSRAAGFAPARELYQMRVPLPLAETPVWPDGHRGARLRARARRRRVARRSTTARSRTTPSRAAWIEATLRRRLAEAWFDPTLFVLAFDADGTGRLQLVQVARPRRSPIRRSARSS